MKMYLISENEMLTLERIRQELCNNNYLLDSEITNTLWRIINRKRSLTFIFNRLFRKI